MRVLDFRSDTVTRPSPEMRRAMADAEVGDDAYGEDPTVRRLEERCAELLGLPAGVFVTSGTQANQIAIGLHCRPGDEVLAEASSHCIQYEGGGMSGLWGAQPCPIASERGILSPEAVRGALRPRNEHYPKSALLCLENTHNRGGGSVWPLQQFGQVVRVAREHRLFVHLDGARLFNAQAASGTPVSAYAGLTDTTSICLSKGLGAPVGSVLCGSRERMREARRLRLRLGGGMRQAGILAAAGLYALEHNIERLPDDHALARKLAEGLREIAGVEVDLSRVETNIVFADFPLAGPEAVGKLRKAGILVNAEGSRANSLRWVCHLDVTEADVREALGRLPQALR
jgi:threonine aldolase